MNTMYVVVLKNPFEDHYERVVIAAQRFDTRDGDLVFFNTKHDPANYHPPFMAYARGSWVNVKVKED